MKREIVDNLFMPIFFVLAIVLFLVPPHVDWPTKELALMWVQGIVTLAAVYLGFLFSQNVAQKTHSYETKRAIYLEAVNWMAEREEYLKEQAVSPDQYLEPKFEFNSAEHTIQMVGSPEILAAFSGLESAYTEATVVMWRTANTVKAATGNLENIESGYFSSSGVFDENYKRRLREAKEGVVAARAAAIRESIIAAEPFRTGCVKLRDLIRSDLGIGG